VTLLHVQDITIIKHFHFKNLWCKIIIFLDPFCSHFFIIESKTMTMKKLWTFMNIKCTYVWSAHQQKIARFVFLVIYHYYQIYCKKPNNINTHIYVRRKMFVKFINHYLPSMVENNLKAFWNKWKDYPFSKQ